MISLPARRAYAARGEYETAFGGRRSNRFGVFMVGLTLDSELLAAERVWVRSFWEALCPYAPVAAGYLNAMTEIEDDRVRASYGPATYERLARIKAEYDLDDVFHRKRRPQTRITTDPGNVACWRWLRKVIA